MKNAEQRVLNMVAEGKISAAEGDELLAAMRSEKRFYLKMLVDPFQRIRESVGILIGVVAALAGVGIALTGGVRFDGFLDLHLVQGTVPVLLAAADQLAAWLLGATALWGVAQIFERGSRWVDFVVGVGVARAVYTLAGGVLMLMPLDIEQLESLARSGVGSHPEGMSAELMSVIPLAIVSLASVVWFVTLLFHAFKHATGLKGGKLAQAVILAIVVAEVVSKLALWGAVRALT